MTDDGKQSLRRARGLLARIAAQKTQLRQRLLLAAAITVLMEKTPIVVGGTAEEYWAGGEYHATDLDLCPPPSPADVKALTSLGLRKVARHWLRDDLPVAVEFPGSGDDIERTTLVKVGGVPVVMISCEDLYLDRIRQATTASDRATVSFDGALEIALTNLPTMDWSYVRGRIRRIASEEPRIAAEMIIVNRRVRSRARRGYLRTNIG